MIASRASIIHVIQSSKMLGSYDDPINFTVTAASKSSLPEAFFAINVYLDDRAMGDGP